MNQNILFYHDYGFDDGQPVLKGWKNRTKEEIIRGIILLILTVILSGIIWKLY